MGPMPIVSMQPDRKFLGTAIGRWIGLSVGPLPERMVGDHDLIMAFPSMDRVIANLANNVPRLRGKFILADCGHWTQQECASEVNAAMIDFLREL
jgi:pimeloyl-ACP methyl ester carboxylesterase